jgi:hypothetical protein
MPPGIAFARSAKKHPLVVHYQEERSESTAMRNMGFQRTTGQMLDRTKTVTRRLGWRDLERGALLQAVEKARGLAKGEKLRKLGVIRVLSVRREPLSRLRQPRYGKAEAAKEGYPELSGRELVEQFVASTGCTKNAVVTRIEFEHV